MTASPPLSFRLAGVDDAPRIAALINAAYRGDSSRAGWTTEADLLDGPRTNAAEIRALVEATDSMILLALHDADLVGSVHLQRRGAAGYLGMFVVRPGLQGAGTGKRLMHAGEARAREAWGISTMTMTVITLRPELIAFYERRGYARTGEIRPFPVEHAQNARVAGIELAVLEKDLSRTA